MKTKIIVTIESQVNRLDDSYYYRLMQNGISGLRFNFARFQKESEVEETARYVENLKRKFGDKFSLANRWNHAVLNIAKAFEIIGLSMLLGILYSLYHSIVLCIVWHALFDFSAGYVLLVRLRKAKPHPVIFDEYE